MRSSAQYAFVAFVSGSLIGAAPAGEREVFAVPLSGTAVAGPTSVTAGDPDASGKVRITIDLARKQVCYDFSLSGISTPLMAHIHRARPFYNGPTVVTLFTGTGGDLDGCRLWTPKQLAAIVSDPSNYYVSLDTLEFPDGAVRGQLG